MDFFDFDYYNSSDDRLVYFFSFVVSPVADFVEFDACSWWIMSIYIFIVICFSVFCYVVRSFVFEFLSNYSFQADQFSEAFGSVSDSSSISVGFEILFRIRMFSIFLIVNSTSHISRISFSFLMIKSA